MEDFDPIEKMNASVSTLEQSRFINMDKLLKERDLAAVADILLEDTFRETDIFRKDLVDRFLDFALFKVQSGEPYILSMAYPSKRIMDKNLEARVISLMNEHLYPEIVLRVLKYFARNLHDSDTNLYLATLIESDAIIQSIYDTFLLFKKDIFIANPDRRCVNVKRVQQVSPRTDNKSASPLDAAARFKYVLEFIAIRKNVSHLYRAENLVLAGAA
jgi:hypothetical protein